MCNKNKGADQLYSYCTADLHLCFHICRLLVFWCGGSLIDVTATRNNTKILMAHKVSKRLKIMTYFITYTHKIKVKITCMYNKL